MGWLDRLNLPDATAQPRRAQTKAALGSRLRDRTVENKQKAALEKAFKAAAWTKAKGKCERCGVRCLKTLALDARRGEVHHKKPRSTSPALKYDVNNSELVCRSCHEKITRHLT